MVNCFSWWSNFKLGVGDDIRNVAQAAESRDGKEVSRSLSSPGLARGWTAVTGRQLGVFTVFTATVITPPPSPLPYSPEGDMWWDLHQWADSIRDHVTPLGQWEPGLVSCDRQHQQSGLFSRDPTSRAPTLHQLSELRSRKKQRVLELKFWNTQWYLSANSQSEITHFRNEAPDRSSHRLPSAPWGERLICCHSSFSLAIRLKFENNNYFSHKNNNKRHFLIADQLSLTQESSGAAC